MSIAGSLTAMAVLWLPARTWLDSDAGVQQQIDFFLSAAS